MASVSGCGMPGKAITTAVVGRRRRVWNVCNETDTSWKNAPLWRLADGREPAADVIRTAGCPVQVPKVPR